MTRKVETDRQNSRPMIASARVAVGLRQLAFLVLLFILFLPCATAFSLEPIILKGDQDKIEITPLGEFYEGRGDHLQVETVPGPGGISGRMAVNASTLGTNPNWAVFAFNNPTGKRIERWLVAERYNIIGSQIFWPDLDANHIRQVTPSIGFLPERIANDHADIFRIELEAGATVTFIAELRANRFPQLYLWRARALETQLRNIAIFRGIMLGITGLLAVFLTAIFVANHKAIFPATAFIAWSVLAYLCVDFGFWHKLFQLSPENNAIYRAATEAAIASSLVMFLYTFLRLSLWHGWIRLAFIIWLLAQISLIGLAILDAKLAAGLARNSFVVIGVIGTILIIYLSIRGQDRALSLIPSWLLFLVWLFGAALAVTGQLSGDIVVSGLIAGLVLIVLLLGFTVTQFAFHAFEPLYGAPPSQLQMRSQALEGAGVFVWEWNARRDEISVSEEVEMALGLTQGSLNRRVEDWMHHMHPADRERFRLLLWSVQEKKGGELNMDFRMRRSDGTYLWFELRAHSVEMGQYRGFKCLGLIRDISNAKRSQERLMHDAVHDNLTGLPNRELFLDRLKNAMIRMVEEGANQPTVLLIDIDRFKNVNTSFGLMVGDSMLLTFSRRLSRHLTPLDTLARIGGDQFAILLTTETDSRHITMLAERVRRSLRSPMKISGKEIILTGSIGIAVYEGTQKSEQNLLREAEIAMYRAKRGGADKVEMFKEEMRSKSEDRLILESDLRRAIDRKQIKIYYQPIVRLDIEEIAGFEALIRWDHPRLGQLTPKDFIPISEETGIIFELGSYVLNQAIHQVARWQKAFPDFKDPLFVSVNVSSRQLFRPDLVQDVSMILKKEVLPKRSLHLEVTESLVMENPEAATEIMSALKNLGADLSLDDFGTGYSSLAYLHQFPFDLIKIDRSLLRQAGLENTGPTIVRSIIALSHELGKEVVAEGIESEEDAFFLKTLKCKYGQGFYFGAPMTDKDLMVLLNALSKTKTKASVKGPLAPSKKKPPSRPRIARAGPAEGQTSNNGANQGLKKEMKTTRTLSETEAAGAHEHPSGKIKSPQKRPE